MTLSRILLFIEQTHTPTDGLMFPHDKPSLPTHTVKNYTDIYVLVPPFPDDRAVCAARSTDIILFQ